MYEYSQYSWLVYILGALFSGVSMLRFEAVFSRGLVVVTTFLGYDI